MKAFNNPVLIPIIFCSSETFKSLNISVRVSCLTGEYRKRLLGKKHEFWLSLAHRLEVVWFLDIAHPDIPKYLTIETRLNRRQLMSEPEHYGLTLNNLRFAVHFYQMNWNSLIS